MTITIGEVLNRLKEEFEDITISKIRFLESEGLISPDRTGSGYRRFSEADIERLRYVLRAQRERYLPLKVIKEELDRLDAGEQPLKPAQPEPPVAPEQEQQPSTPTQPPTGAVSALAGDVAMTGEELARATGLTPEQVQQLAGQGLLSGALTHDGADLAIATQAARLLEQGLDLRHLRMFRHTAQREAGSIETLVAPMLRARSPRARREAAQRTAALIEASAALQRALLEQELAGLLRP